MKTPLLITVGTFGFLSIGWGRAPVTYDAFLRSSRTVSSVADPTYDQIYDPFQFRSASRSRLSAKEEPSAAVAKAEDVTISLGKRGVQGIVFATQDEGTTVVIGDNLFHVGDELTFSEEDKFVPLLASAKVYLRRIRRSHLEIQIQQSGFPAQTIAYSLVGFWRR